ncbi:glycosyltransferase family 2 protein [Candidatus Uhrbacteria bacterium]|nr:glycosyltransferase family 2 protein [Candidatus Uhrbacteria bacterium]
MKHTTGKKNAEVCLIVITYNGEKDIIAFLESLNEVSAEIAYSFVAVDNHSDDGTTAAILRLAPHAHIIRNTDNKGYAAAANQGIQYAIDHGAKYVFVANQDLLFEKDFFTPLVREMESDLSIAALQPLIMLDPERELINSCGNALHPAGFGYTRGYRLYPSVSRSALGNAPKKIFSCEKSDVAYCSGAAVLFRISALKRVGLFDEEYFMYHEDTDLCWRLRIAGYRCVVDPAAVVYHHYEFSRSIKKFYYMERNRLAMMLKNYSFTAFMVFIPLVLFWEAGMLLYSALMSMSGKGTLTWKEKVRAYRYFFSERVWRSLLAKRAAVQKSRIVPDSVIVRLFDPAIEFQDVDNPLLQLIANPITRCYFFLARQILRMF